MLTAFQIVCLFSRYGGACGMYGCVGARLNARNAHAQNIKYDLPWFMTLPRQFKSWTFPKKKKLMDLDLPEHFNSVEWSDFHQRRWIILFSIWLCFLGNQPMRYAKHQHLKWQYALYPQRKQIYFVQGSTDHSKFACWWSIYSFHIFFSSHSWPVE